MSLKQPPTSVTLSPELCELARSALASDDVTHHRQSSTVVRALGSRRYHFKRGSGDMSREAALLESLLNGPARAAAAVRFVGYDREQNVLVTEHINGVSLFNVIWNASAWWRADRAADYVDPVERTLRWLQWFHTPAGTQDDLHVHENRVINEVEQRLSRLQQIGVEAWLTPQATRAIGAHLAHARRVRWAALRVGRIHGDLTPHANVLVDHHGDVFILDFGESRVGFFAEDILRLWTSVWEVAESNPVRRWRLRRVLERISRAAGQELQTEAAELIRVSIALGRLYEASKGFPGANWRSTNLLRRCGRLHAIWLNKRFG